MMTFEEAKKIFLNRGYVEVPGGTYYDADKWRESITVISKWLEQEPCEDAVSREAVMNILGDSINDDKDYNRAVVLLNNLPPVTPKERIGKWETTTTTFCGRTFEVIQCSCCKQKQNWYAKTDFCPNCGARMESE